MSSVTVEAKKGKGGTTYAAKVYPGGGLKKVHVRAGYATREEAQLVGEEFLRTGKKPEAAPRTRGRERYAAIREVQLLEGNTRFWVCGRDGQGKEAQRGIHVGSFSTRAEAERAVAAFEATGETVKMNYQGEPRAKREAPMPRKKKEKPAPEKPAPQAARRNLWAERYGNS